MTKIPSAGLPLPCEGRIPNRAPQILELYHKTSDDDVIVAKGKFIRWNHFDNVLVVTVGPKSGPPALKGFTTVELKKSTFHLWSCHPLILFQYMTDLTN